MQRHRHDPSKSLVGFEVGDVAYAVPIVRVKEITNPLTLVPLPHAPRSVVGVADYRGRVVAVVDLRIRFGLAPRPVTRRTKWIVVDVGARPLERNEGIAIHDSDGRRSEPGREHVESSGGGLVALVVDAVSEAFGSGGAELRPAPALGSGDDVRGIAGVITHANSLVFVLETERLRDLADVRSVAPPSEDSARGPGLLPGAGGL